MTKKKKKVFEKFCLNQKSIFKVLTVGGVGFAFFDNGSSSSDSSFLLFSSSSSSPVLSSLGGFVTAERFGRSLDTVFEFLLLLFAGDPFRLGTSCFITYTDTVLC